MSELIAFLVENNINFEENVLLKKRTWLKTGGFVKVWIEPSNGEELVRVAEYFYKESIQYQVIGHTSNIYFLDSTNLEVIVSTKNIKSFQQNHDVVLCDCGVSVSRLSRYFVDLGYVGFSGLVNLPGTIAAAVVNNSSCFDCSISNILKEVLFFNQQTGAVEHLSVEQLKYSHRSSMLKRKELKGIIISVSLNLKQGNLIEEKEKALVVTKIRKETQEPPAYTLGSVFADLERKSTLFLKIYLKIIQMLTRLRIIRPKSLSELLLKFYGYEFLFPYVSKKNINTFIWKPEIIDKKQMFDKYVEFMHKAFVNLKLEIEIR